MIELGGNITLVGFKDLDHAELIVVKKLVGSYARKMLEISDKFEGLTVTMKEVHKTAKNNQKYELHGKLMSGKAYTSEVTDKNIFIALDSVLKKIIATISK
jgi:ribosome-associated translation inhibitor RaiA